MKKKSVWIAVCTAALLALGMLVSGIAVAADKTDICHLTGNGGFQLINVSNRALTAHLGHGDFLGGETSSPGTPYPGLYGSEVTPLTLIGADCSSSIVLKVVNTHNFQQGQAAGNPAGWAGWSCVDSYLGDTYFKVVGGGVVPEDGTIIAQGAAKDGAASVGGSNYPVYPHYTFGAGEEGWVVEAAGPTPPTAIYVLCGQ